MIHTMPCYIESISSHDQFIIICPEDFSKPGGELTPTIKLKRRIVTDKYKDLITEMYEESAL